MHLFVELEAAGELLNELVHGVHELDEDGCPLLVPKVLISMPAPLQG